MPTTFIKLDRSIAKWRWFRDRNTLQLWIYILLNANVTDRDFMKITIHRGQLATSHQSLSEATGLTVNQVRTALEHLTSTGEITIRRHPKFLLISAVNYDLYQGWAQADHNQTTIKPQSDHRQTTDKPQQYNNERMKEVKNAIMKECEEPTHSHGRFNNVFLTDSEYEKFCADYPLIAEEVIDELSEKIITDKGRYRNGHIGHLYIFARNYREKKTETEHSPSYDIELAMKRSLMIDPTKTKRGQ